MSIFKDFKKKPWGVLKLRMGRDSVPYKCLRWNLESNICSGKKVN